MEIVTTNVQCPTCCMTARSSDFRHLRPIAVIQDNDADIRECRNCGEIIRLNELEASV